MPGRTAVLVLFCLVLLLIVPPALAQQVAGVCMLRIRGAERANVRQEPGQGSAIVARFEPGQSFVASDKVDTPDGSWYQVEGGWVAAWLVEPAGGAVNGYLVVKMSGSPYSGAFDVEVPAGVYFGTVCPEIIHGTEANDTLRGGHGDDVLIGYAGNDMLSGDQGDDILFGGSGSDALYGSGGLNVVYAMGGADRVFSFASIDDYVLLDGFAPYGNITRAQVVTWFGADVIETEFAASGVIGDAILTTNFIYVGERQ